MAARSKYGNERMVVDNIRFASKAEAAHYAELTLLERAGVISGLTCQPRYQIADGFREADGRWHRALVYVADFRHLDVATGKEVVTDIKGHVTEGFRIKRHLFLLRYPQIDFRVIPAKS